jgi:hypothetical protein
MTRELALNTSVILLGASGPDLNARRRQAVAGYLARLRGVADGPARILDEVADLDAALATLATFAMLTPHAEDGLRYTPSRSARDAVFGDAGAAGWPKPVVARHAKRARHTDGALFRFPLAGDGPDGDDPAGELTVFITDWSPAPAAAALAVHPQHPLGVALPDPDRPAAFTGRFCRHPLTGDLLPVWTAAWVKPEFGTGAVLVNPGHDVTDLAFARRIGLPVRFGLAASTDTSPASWPEPPVLRSGVAIRSGPTDGLAAEQASAAYFELLRQRGYAERYTDHGVGAFPLGPEPAGSPLLAVCAGQPADRIELLAPTATVDTELLAIRLLLAEPDRPWASSGDPAIGVTTLAPVTGTMPDDLEPAAAELALIAGAAPADPVTIKAQLTESAQRFVRTHASLVSGGEAAIGQPAEPASLDRIGKAADAIGRLLLAGDTRQVFTQLYRLQKDLAKAGPLPEPVMMRYEVLCYVLAGLDSRYSPRRLAEIWQQL